MVTVSTKLAARFADSVNDGPCRLVVVGVVVVRLAVVAAAATTAAADELKMFG